MATVAGTIKMFDAMTGPLKRITQTMNIMISTMHDMENATKGNIQMDKMLSAAKQQLALAEAEINSAINKSTQAQHNFNKAVSNSRFTLNGIVDKVFAINEALELMQQLWNGITASMDRADEILGVHSRLNFVNDGLQTQYELQEKILKSANATRSSYRDTSDTIAKLGLFAPNLFKSTDRLIGFTETLNKLFVASGAGTVDRQVALQQLGQALSSGVLQGDELRSISESAPLFMDQLAKGIGVARGELKGMGADGKLTADVVVKAIEKQANSIDKLFQTMPMTFGGAFAIINNKIDAWIGKMYEAGGPLRYLTNQLENMISWMDSDRGAAFFSGMTAALNVLIYSIVLFGKAFGAALNIAIDYGPEITAVLATLALYLIPLLTAKLWAMAAPVRQIAISFWSVHWPILVVALAIGVLILILRQFGVTTDQIVGFVTGVFMVFFAAIQNGIGFVWNHILALAEFLANIFIDPVYAIQKLFYDMLKNVSSYFSNWSNNVVDVLNWLISKINEVSGMTIQAIAKQDNSWIEKFKPETNKAVVDLSKYQMQQKDLGAAYKSGYNWGTSAWNQFTNGPAAQFGPMVPGGAMDKIANINKVGEVGKIRDSVDISSEDLKTMRELAEMKNIQNFVTLTPVVQVTGDNHYNSGYDIDTVISRINRGLEEEIASSAKMVLNV
ncbi:tape measure protein [Brevibacillus sp. M2.1A]|uniref:tape measure protein n=1 Tax=Brevibacillus sp. M2.1A TaxID=2738980 RepID=UPI00156A7A86|nr:tape measure protein [Brevibacillus sp. M2.1A]MCC8435484.1 tape measure protein [Brevibacillus sp. M2.1A]